MPTSSKPNVNFFAVSTDPICWVVSIVCLLILLAFGNCSLIFTFENDKNPKL